MRVDIKRYFPFNLLFLLTVIIPTVLAILYFGFITSDVYVSESRFVVRSPERQTTSPLGAVLRGAGFSQVQDDSHTVHDYILSRDALGVLDKQLGIGRAFASKDVDRLSRFGGLDPDDSFEALHRYYQGKVAVQTDTATSISTLTVRAFTAAGAQQANRLLLELSEDLVNRLNERGRSDMVKYAALEVAQAAATAKNAALALSSYRNSQSVVDPERQAGVQLQQVMKLQEELMATNVQLAQLKSFTPQNPQISGLQLRARTLEGEISRETGKVTGAGQSLASKAAQYQRLVLDREFADKQLASVLISLENARNEARRQQVYLERIAQPSLPDVAQEPRRLRSVLATLILGLVAYGILTILLAGVREHRD